MTHRLRLLHQALVDELHRRGHDPGQPLKVAELHEDLVPYRTARSVLDVHVRADYEHTLLRLLAGEESLLRLEPDSARDELRREVDKPYPDVSLYRKFAASDVFVSPATADAHPPGTGPVEPEPARGDGDDDNEERDGPWVGPDAAETTPPVEAVEAVEAVDAVDARPGSDRDGESGRPTERVGAVGEDCLFCGRALPGDRVTRFCPQCGGDQRLEPCPRCGEPLEPAWRFCIACGQEQREG